MLHWRILILNVFIPKVVNILYEHFHVIQHCALRDLLSSFFWRLYLSELSASQNCYKRAIAGEKYTVKIVFFINVLRCDIQSD